MMTRAWEWLNELVSYVGPVPLMVLAAVVYFSPSDLLSKIKLPGFLKREPKSHGIDTALGVLHELSGLAVKSGNQELLSKVTDLYKYLQTSGVNRE